VIVGQDDASAGRDWPVPQPRVAPSGDGQRGRPALPPGPPPRPPIVDDPGIWGLSRVARSRIGSRLFTWFFVLVFTVIVVQMVAAMIDPEW
jgi:hypothetical protein